jgi:hypothetical protein
MKNLFTALLLTAAAATTAQAQTTVSFGPRLGLNVSRFAYSGTPQQFDEVKNMTGLQVGGTANIRFGDGKLAFQPSIIFSRKGAELKSTGNSTISGSPFGYTVTAKPKFEVVELPLNFVYTFGGDEGFQVFAGPYVAFGVGGGGSYSVDFKSSDPNLMIYNQTYPGSLKVEYGSNQNPNDDAQNGNTGFLGTPTLILTFHRFDAGLNAGVGYRVGPVQAQLAYGLGLVNFVPNDPDGNDTGSKGYHRGFQLSANYFFGGK